jgi:uncharacterized protein YukE
MDDFRKKLTEQFEENMKRANSSLTGLHDCLNKREDTMEDIEDVIEDIDETEETEEPEDIEVVSGDFVIDIDDFKDDKIFKTSEVAQLCNLSRQNVRNLLKIWEPVIRPDRDQNGAALWSKANVLKLREMLLVKQQFGLTVSGVLDHYTKASSEMLGIKNPDSDTEVILDQFQRRMERSISEKMAVFGQAMKAMIDESMKPLLLEQKEQKDDETMKEILETVRTLKKRDEEREKELRKLREENERLQKEKEELQKKKRFSLFG